MKRRMCLALVLILGAGAGSARSEIRIDGSSTVYPISLAIAEEFSIDNPDVELSVAFSGTGGGFSKFCAGEIQVNNASRVIKESEIEACAAQGTGFIEIPVAADALTVAVNPENDWLQCVTVAQLQQIWAPDSVVERWRDVDPAWPANALVLYGPGTDSGTFDYFTEAVNGAAGAVRTDYFPSEDDNVLAQGIESDRYALGFFGFAYYVADKDRLKALEVDGGDGCVAPSAAAIENNSYVPLSRPLFIYVSLRALEKDPAVQAFVDYYLAEDHRVYITDTGYAAYSQAVYQAVQERVDARISGSAFLDFQPGDSVLEAVQLESAQDER